MMNTQSHNHSTDAFDSLARAIKAGDCGAVQDILQQLPSGRQFLVQRRDKKGRTALDMALSANYHRGNADFDAVLEAINRGDHATARSILGTDKKGIIVDLLFASGATVTANSIINAAMDGGYSELSTLLERATGSTVNERNELGWTALQMAVAHDKGYSILSKLLEKGADPNLAAPSGQPVLHIAVRKDQGYSIISALLRKGADPSTAGADGETALHIALSLESGYMTVSELIKHSSNINHQNLYGHTALHVAVNMKKASYDVIECLLQARCDTNVRDSDGMSALHYHAMHGEATSSSNEYDGIRSQIEEQLRASQEQLNEQLRNFSAQMRHLFPGAPQLVNPVPIDLGDGTIVSALINAGSDVNSIDHTGATPLFHAAEAGHLEVLVALIHAGANPNLQNHESMTPLLLATVGENPEVVDALLQAGAAVNTADINGNTCLHFAANNESNEVLSALLFYGANPNAVNKLGETPLHRAVGESVPLVQALLSAGSDVNKQDNNGWAALHHAVFNSSHSMDILELVLQAGANVLQMSNGGQTALMVAAIGDVDLDLITTLIHRDPTQLSLKK